jgi:Leucine-rich repeat (LRR) protein
MDCSGLLEGCFIIQIIRDEDHGRADPALPSIHKPPQLAATRPAWVQDHGHREHGRHAGTSSLTQNFFECIDLSDNELRRLGNFTNLDRLTSVVATNNRIKVISPDLADSLPNLENIFLMNNKIGDLEEVAKLAACKRLQRLVLANNLVAELPNYRLFAIAKIPSLRILDFAKISAKERREAEAMFGVE